MYSHKIALLTTLIASSWQILSAQMIVSIDKFENEANAPSEYFHTLRSRITDNIINTRKFEVVERQRLSSVLSERKLAASGATTEDTAPEADQLKGAAYILYGSVLSLGMDRSQTDVVGLSSAKSTAKVEIQLRIASAETGKILSSKTIVGEKSQSRMAGDSQRESGNVDEQALTDAIRDAAQKVTEALTDLAFPSKIVRVGGDSVTLNLTQEQTSVGVIYDVFKIGDEIIDEETGESYGADEELVGRIQITRTSPRTSVAVPYGSSTLDQFENNMIARRVSEDEIKKEKATQKRANNQKFESRF